MVVKARFGIIEEVDPSAVKLDQTHPQSFTGGDVTGSGLLKVTLGTLGLDTNSYLTTESDPLSIHKDQSTPQTFTGGAVTGTGILKVTSGELGLDTNVYLADAPSDGKAYGRMNASWTQVLTSANIDGDIGAGWSAITGVVLPNDTKYVPIPYSGLITGYMIVASPAGSAVIDIWKATGALPTVANTITASAKPTIVSSAYLSSTTLTGWTTSFSKGDVFGFNVDSSSTCTKLEIHLITEKA